jgi:hypothetical protein
MATANENLGPAERIIQAILTHQDHMVHNRPGMVSTDGRAVLGVRWEPVTHKVEADQKVVYRLIKVGKKSTTVRVGTLRPDGQIMNGGPNPIAEYRDAGLFPEVVTWLYRQVADVWKLDNEFAARWASYAFAQEHRDLKVVLAAFLLVQSRKGDPVIDAGKIAFHDEDYRDVGEAMMLLHDKAGKRELNPKLLLRIDDVLNLPGIAAINRELGFGKSAKRAFRGRWDTVVEKWLRYREENPKVLEGLVKAGFRTTVMELARRVGYKPDSPKFFEALRWKQAQADDGRRTLAIGVAVQAAESWEGLTEQEICERVVKEKPNWKRVVGLLPKKIGVTRAIMTASIESGSLSSKDLIILTPTLEELGLLEVQEVKARWEKAIKTAEDMRAANIARNVKSQVVKEKLQEAADIAVQKAVEEVTRNMRIYFMVDISGSMAGAIELAKQYIAKFLQGFPADRIHIATFNTTGKEITLRHSSAVGVENAFKGIAASGGTDYGAGVRALQHHRPKDDEDVLFIFVGDEEASSFEAAVRVSNLNPLAFGLLKTVANQGAAGWRARHYGADNNVAVRETATKLGIPCFKIEEETFADPYAITRTVRALVAATPVGAVPKAAAVQRVTLVDQILKTALLQKPAWAS